MCLLCAHKELIECACATERVILSCTGSKRSQKRFPRATIYIAIFIIHLAVWMSVRTKPKKKKEKRTCEISENKVILQD